MYKRQILYLLTLRFFVISLVPSNHRKEDVDEDIEVLGKIVDITSDIIPKKEGRISHSGTSWQAISEGDQTILKGEKAKIVGRDNITWIVQKI